ncbi:hypothetical protein [Brucella gallinifaecis]|uniref:hypothetical protein n=1 Tax=Brucella gallinifaecis TaxID=215590 RepID=UPI00236276D6|nr:hypothetical protein [Brucella gallinifaecis]
MNNDIKNAIAEAAKNTGLSHQAVFDQAVKILNIEILGRLDSPENAQFTSRVCHVPFFDMDRTMSHETFMEFDIVARYMIKAFNESAPFEDVIGQYYEDEFLKERQPEEWFITPERVTEFVGKVKRDIKKTPVHATFVDAGCRTGLQTLSFLKQIFHACGKNKMYNRLVGISDPNPALLRIAICQVMVNCLRHDMRIGSLIAYNYDLLADFDDAENHKVFVVSAMTGAARKAAQKASEKAILANNYKTQKAA